MNKFKINIIDYGMGNLRSVAKALENADPGIDVQITDSPLVLDKADAIVLPGVGSFEPAIKCLKYKKLEEVIKKIIDQNKPFLGICLGFQLLFEFGMEEGVHEGLNLIKGKVKKFDIESGLKIPHIGWNKVKIASDEAKNKMFKNIPDNSYFYFVHSYYGDPVDKNVIAGTTDYGLTFCSSILNKNIWACQFHPEKSGETGIQLLKNFIHEVKKC